VLRRFLTSHPRHCFAAGLIFLLVGASFRLLSPESWLGARLVNASYDWSQRLSLPAGFTNSPVFIVYLDLDSYLRERQNPAEPWSRTLHARLLDRLTRAGARAVVYDIIFGEAGPYPQADASFADAIRRNGKVVLAAEISSSSRSTYQVEGIKSHQITMPDERFLKFAAAWGIANASADEDFVVRRHFMGFAGSSDPTLTLAAAKLTGLDLGTAATWSGEAPWVRYYGGPLTIPHVNFSAALDPTAVADEFFRGKIIFIGARPMAGTIRERKDEFRSPLASWGDEEQLFMPAVEVHATEMVNLVREDSLRRFPPLVEALTLLLCAMVLVGGGLLLRPSLGWGLAMGGELAGVFGAGAWLPAHHVWFPWLIVGVVQIPGALGGSVLYQSLAWYRQRRRSETQRRTDEAKIREQASLIEKAQDAIMVVGIEGDVLFANPSARQLHGWNSDINLNGVAAKLLFPADEARFNEARRAAVATGEWLGEMEHTVRDGYKVTVAARCTLIQDERGQPKSLLFISTDVTEKKRLEAEFYRAQRLESIGALAGGMAHDLNNALSPILMGLQLLQRENHDEETRRMLSVMEDNTHRGADMVRQVLLFSRGREEEREALPPGNLIREVERMMRQTFPKSIRLATMVPEDLWPLVGNSTQLHQVLLNLCVNARDAMPGGGEITLAADNVELTAEEARQIPGGVAGRFVMLVVSDTGPGISPEILPRIFEPFFTTKPVGQGTGLGLSTVARVIKQHGGFIHVRSEPGQGATFDIYLPSSGIAPVNPAGTQTCGASFLRGAGQWILVADDEQAVREMLVLALTSEGYRVATAVNGAEALTLFEQVPGSFCLALLDADMPVMNGIAAAASLRSKSPQLPILLMSGNPAEIVSEDASGVLAKPFHLNELISMVASRMTGS
jgi:PAS domain S-box-containing protein